MAYRDSVFFFKLTSIHNRVEMNNCLQVTDILKWITKQETSLIQKDPQNESALNNFRRITYLLMMWKILTAQINEGIYLFFISRRLFLERGNEIEAAKEPATKDHIMIHTPTARGKIELNCCNIVYLL